ncbi:thioredoxin domain-containing protein 5 homolog [Epargyreus clarus]|uniref:thioredoxin domain-containing protein 5 homolog n=1 Tax=Epargyreus clarus TaxID=520877 RepID=UPI003C2C7E1F
MKTVTLMQSCSLVLILFFPHFVMLDENSVYEYDPGIFRQQIEDLDGNFIMFYAPWCRYCTEFMPIWQGLAELVNTKDSKFAIAQVDCTQYASLCNEIDITGFPTLLYFYKHSFLPVEYKGTRDMPALTLFLSEVFKKYDEKKEKNGENEVQIYSGMAYLTDHNIEKFLVKGQHFIMFYAPWCKESQRLAPIWADLAVQYAHNRYIQIGKVNCLENEMTCKSFEIKQYPYLLWIVNGRVMGVSNEKTLLGLQEFIEKMALAENHDPEKFMSKKKALPVARITEETYDTFLEKNLVFVHFFAPWCAHCMQINPLWVQLGETFLNEERVIIADIDCVRSKPICDSEKINVLPTLILYKSKKIVSLDHGGQSLETLIALVNENLKSLNEGVTFITQNTLEEQTNEVTLDEESNKVEKSAPTKDEL